MARRTHVKRQPKFHGEHEATSYRENGYRDNSYSDNKRGKEQRGRHKRKAFEEPSNIVDLIAHNNQIETAYTPNRTKAPLRAQTPAQQCYINAIKNHSLTFGIGPAGTGKSYCAGALAAEALESGRIERII
ncbi:MAG: PhoH family protein, partial [Burkholderiales bacterium]